MIAQVEGLARRMNVTRPRQTLGVPRSSLYCAWAEQQDPKVERRESNPKPRNLILEEKINMRQIFDSECLQDLTPREVYATLLDEGQYVCHWRTVMHSGRT
jgi:putative transposase